MLTPENHQGEPFEEKEFPMVPKNSTDMEAALFLINHIINPCEVNVSPDKVRNIRQFYLTEAGRILPSLTNEFAKELLLQKVEEYKNKE